MKIFVVGQYKEYADFIYNHKHVDSIEKADIVIFTGGADVSPILYDEKNKYSYSDNLRDMEELSAWAMAKAEEKPCLGICRGSQFLTVINGGKLIQDVDNHGIMGTHNITNNNKECPVKQLEITSTHHQMLYPFNLSKDKYEIIAHSSERRSTKYLTGFGSYSKDEVEVEPEIVFYNKSKDLAIQGHPEYMDLDSNAVKYCNWLINKYLL